MHAKFDGFPKRNTSMFKRICKFVDFVVNHCIKVTFEFVDFVVNHCIKVTFEFVGQLIPGIPGKVVHHKILGV